MRLRNRFLIIVMVYILSLAGGVIADDEYLKCKGCNLVLLDLDLLRADFVNTSTDASVTPNIDRFFGNSIKFLDVSSSSGVTAISNTATLSSRHGAFTYALLRNTYEDRPPQIPLRHLNLFKQTPTLLETLKARGYYTINANHGWYAGRQMLLDRGVDNYVGLGEVYNQENTPGRILSHTANVLSTDVSTKVPFVLLMRSEDLRGLPYRYPIDRARLSHPKVIYKESPDSNYYEIRYQLRRDGVIDQGYSSFEKSDWMNSVQSQEYTKISKMLYRQQLRFVDEMIASVFDALRETKLLDNTIVILYSNHGDGLYDNNIPNHGVSYQSCVSVPLFIRHPRYSKDINISRPVALIDLVPTIIDILDIEVGHKFDGVSLLETIRSGLYPGEHFFGVDKQSKYVRHNNYKLIVWPDRSKELFDLATDPGETVNLVDVFPDMVKALEERLLEHEAEQLELAYDLLRQFGQP